MADLNPLAFKVAIQDEATGQLNKIEQEFEKLKDKSISVKITGLDDLRNLLSALQHQQVNDIGKDLSKQLGKATQGIQKDAQDAIRKSLGELAANLVSVKQAIQHDNFNAFSDRIMKAAESMNVLNEAFEKFHVTIGKNEGMTNFMTGLGEVIKNVRVSMQPLLEQTQKTSAFDSMRKNITTAVYEQERLNNLWAKGAVYSERFGKLGFNTSSLDKRIAELDKIQQLLRTGKETGTLSNGLTATQYLSQESVSKAISALNEELSLYRQIGSELERMTKLRNQLNEALAKNPNTSYQSDIANMVKYLEQRMAGLTNMGKQEGLSKMRIGSFLTDDYREQLRAVPVLLEAISKEQRKAQSENDRWAESMRVASIKATTLGQKIRELQAIETSAKGLGVKTGGLSSRIAELQQLQRILRSIEGGSKQYGTAQDFVNSAQYQKAISLANEEAKAVKKSAQEKEQAVKAAQQLTTEQQKLANAMSQTTQAARGQSQVLSDLKSLATQYLGVWGGQQFLHNIIEIGGQLEMQRLSIGAILQNQSQANVLFNQIKGLARESPFGVVQLDQMTKQLTAYGFKYSELFDMTKRLADISAATGTDVSRLALALGHVRSEAALSGYTLRQFSMGNVPLLQKLSEKLGKTTKEIREMVRAKEISYEDVVGVLKDLTNDGGMFYNMQAVISESVKARYKNVKDSMDIMYGEMAEGAIGDVLKDIGIALMDMTTHWKDLATVLGTGAALWAINRTAMLLYTQTIGATNAATLSSIAAYRQKEATLLRQASLYRTLSAAEKTQIATAKTLTAAERVRLALHIPLTAKQRQRIALAKQQQTADLSLAFSQKKLTIEDLARLVATGRVSKAQARQIITTSTLDIRTKQAAFSTIKHTQALTGWRLALLKAQLSLAGLGRALKAVFLSPQMWAMAAIMAITELWMRNRREAEAAEELSDKIYQHSQDAIKNTRTVMDSSGMKIEDNSGKEVNGSDLDLNSIAKVRLRIEDVDKENMSRLVDEWTDYINNYAANAGQILNKASFDAQGNILSLEDRFKNLKEVMEEVILAQYGLQDLGPIFESAVKATDGGWFDDNVLTDIADYDKATKAFGSTVASTYKKYRQDIDNGVKAAMKADKAFAEATKSMETYAAKFKYLVEHQGDFTKVRSAFVGQDAMGNAIPERLNAIQDGEDSFRSLNAQKQEMEAELESFYIQVEAELQTRGIKLNNLTKQQQQALLLGYKDKLESIQGLSKEAMDDLMQRFAKHFNIELDLDDPKFITKVDAVTEILNSLVEGDWKVELNFVSNIGDAIDEARKKYKLAKEYFEKTESIRMKFGIELKMGDVMDEETMKGVLDKIGNKEIRDQVEKVIKGLNQASEAYNKSTEASKNLGFSLEDEKKSKGGSKNKSSKKTYKDEFAKRWDERIRIMKEAYGWYDKWEKKVGNDEAIAETNSKYADIFAEWRTDKVLPMNFDVNEIADYTKYVEKIRDDALRRYKKQKNDKGKNNGQEALRVYRQAVSLLNDVKFDSFTKAAEEFRSIIEQTISDLNERWDMYKTVREATGNPALASSVAGFGATDAGARTSADAMRSDLLRQIHNAGGYGVANSVILDSHLDEEGIRKQFEDAIPDADEPERYKEKIDGLIKAYQEWQKLQKAVVKEDVSVFANLIGSVVSYDEKLKKLKLKLQDQKDSINSALTNGNITKGQADRATDIAQAQYDWEEMKLSADYVNIYNNAVAMSREEYEKAAASIETMLNRLRELGIISSEDYISEKEKLDKTAVEWTTTGFLGERGAVGQFISGGYDGLKDYYGERRDKARQKAEKETDPQKKKGYQDESEHYGKLFKNMSKLSDAAKDVVTAFSLLQSGLDLATNLFDSLGMEGAANAVGDAADVAGGMMQGAQSLSALGPWGMAAGAGLGLISGLAQVHDKRLQREIEKLREDVQQIEANTKLIEQARERTLGFDTGDTRRDYAAQYAPHQTQAQKLVSQFPWLQAYFGSYELLGYDSKAEKSMNDYYNRNSSGTGYAQEYRNLKEQRADYMEMLDKEESKKKKSQSSIDETKEKIAELDDEIRYFSQDLANELFEIDIKGWADQLSDALSSAFENGESMAEAYKDTVTSILQTVMNKMMQLAILEPMMQNLQDTLFGNTEKNITGVFDPEDPEGSMARVTSAISGWFGKGGEGRDAVTAANEFMTAFQRGLENAGLSVLNDSSNTLSSSVQGTSEETSNLLAGYVNALRQDVSTNRILLTQFVTQMWPEYFDAFVGHVKVVTNIDSNVQAMMEMMQYGRGAMYDELAAMRTRIDNVVNGIESFTMK